MSKNRLLAAVFAALAATAISAPAGANASTAPRKTLTAFASEQELTDLFKRWADETRRREEARRRDIAAQGLMSQAAPASPAAAAPKAAAEAVADSITNVQHAGVDEGGIVKLHGEHLVILRRGRLFTVRIAGGSLEAGLVRRRVRPRRRSARRVVRRDADRRQHDRGDRLQLRARRHRDRPVRDLRAGRLAHKGDLPPALERLLLVAQLREPPDRHQARLLHAALPQPVGTATRTPSFRRCASGARARRRRSSSASPRRRASTAPTNRSIRRRASPCTR